MRYFLLIVGIVVFALWSYDAAIARGECVPVRGSLMGFGDYELRRNVIAAMRAVAEQSPVDYDLLCRRVRAIEARDLSYKRDNRNAQYQPDSSGDLTQKGAIQIRRKPIFDAEDIEGILVHETCHAVLVQTRGDFSQEPCFLREHAYVLAKPEKSPEEKSARLIRTAGYERHAWCRLSGVSDGAKRQGSCVFINNGLTSATMCAQVFFRMGTERSDEQEVCAELEQVSYREVLFPVDSPGEGARFDFSSPDRPSTEGAGAD